MDAGSICNSHRCINSTMAQEKSLGKSSLVLNSTNSSKSNSGKSNNDDSSSILGISPLVPSSKAAINSPPILLKSQEIFQTSETPFRNPKWRILVCNISGHGISRKAFQKRLSTFSYQHWIRTLRKQCHLISRHGFLGATYMNRIPLLAL